MSWLIPPKKLISPMKKTLLNLFLVYLAQFYYTDFLPLN